MAANSTGVVGLLKIILALDSAQFDSGTKRSGDVAKRFEKDLRGIGRQATEIGKALTAGVTLPIVGFAAAAVKAAADFEQSFANVRKTVGEVGGSAEASAKFYADLEQFIRKTATELPKTTEELARIAALGGQFGISAEGLKTFVTTVAQLDIAVTDLSGEQAAEGLAQLRNIARVSEQDISRMASALVVLGANGASTEGNILELSKRIAGAGTLIGLTVPQIMGISAAIANVGINAEAGGTAFSRTLSQMSAAVDSGGDKLDAFARIAGVSAQEFATQFKGEPMKAVEMFIQGLARSKDAGENLTLILGDIGSEGVRQADTLKRLTLAHADVVEQVRMSAKAYQENDGHLKAAAEKSKTFWSQLDILKNRLKDAGIELGNVMLPQLVRMIDIVTPAVDILRAMAQAFAALPAPLQTVTFVLVGLTAAVGPALWGFGQMTTATAAIIGAFGKTGIATRALLMIFPSLGTAAAAAAVGVTALQVATGGFVIAAAAAGIAILIDHYNRLGEAAEEAEPKVRRLNDLDANNKKILTLDEAKAAAKETGAGMQQLGLQINLAANPMGRLGMISSQTAPKLASLTDQLAKTKQKVAELTADQVANIKAGVDMNMTTGEIVKKMAELYPALGITEAAVELVKDRLVAGAKAAEEKAEALTSLIEKLRAQKVEQDQATTSQAKYNAELQKMFGGGSDWLTAWIAKISLLPSESLQATAEASKATQDWANKHSAVLAPSIQDSSRELHEFNNELEVLKGQLREQITSDLLQFPQMMAQALVQGGGFSNALKGFTSKFGSDFAQGFVASAFGVTGPIGQGIAGAVGSLLPMVSKLWGGASAEVKQARTEVTSFQDTLHKTLSVTQRQEAGNAKWKMTVIAVRDAYLATGRTAAEADRIVQQLWNTDRPDAARAAMEQINTVLEEQKAITAEQNRLLEENKEKATDLFDEIMDAGSNGIPAAFQPTIDKLIETGLLTDDQIEKLRTLKEENAVNTAQMEADIDLFKGKIESLGPAYAKAKIDETSAKYVNAIERLVKGGADIGAVLGDAKEEISELVQKSMEAGVELPAQMRPWIEAMIAAGTLTDKNGEKITDITKIKFGDAFKTEAEKTKELWDAIALKLDELIDKISKGLGDALDHVTRDRTVNIDANIDTGEPRNETGRGPRQSVEPDRFAGDGIGRPSIAAITGLPVPTLRGQSGLAGDMLPSMPPLPTPFAASSPVSAFGDVPPPGGRGGAGGVTSFNVLPFIFGDRMSPYQMAREAVRHLVESALPMNEQGLTTAIEQVIRNYTRTANA